ncbi:hypothetical protein MYSTI_06215 [Myxococcus stipitatus DSM 14675]|uniref:Uncharacterized protein n=1 Tax=Myxococcus stipitatus (strain DSM 14675 / JCM 12634 / Mx s8) TaxID=1278073 RepID=L7UHJ8_MYXSD|nr:hypothetical protein MYSTI_06215 [Myxococcus stipitatus DSM 14675]
MGQLSSETLLDLDLDWGAWAVGAEDVEDGGCVVACGSAPFDCEPRLEQPAEKQSTADTARIDGSLSRCMVDVPPLGMSLRAEGGQGGQTPAMPLLEAPAVGPSLGREPFIQGQTARPQGPYGCDSGRT